MSLAYVTDHEARGAALLTEQFKYQPATVALLKSWVAQVQALEDHAYELQVQRTLAGATGVNLEIVGALVGQGREGRSDAHYRLWIAGRILVNKSRGRAPQLIAIATKLTGGPVRLREYSPAAFIIYADSPVTGSDGVEIAKLLKLAKAGGVSMQFVWYDTEQPFRFSPLGISVLSSARGFTRGRFAGVSDGRDMVFSEPPPEPEYGGGAGGALLVVL